MDKEQKNTALLLAVIGIIYFIVFIFPNLTGAHNEHMLFMSSQDESFQYTFLKNMLTPGRDIHETRSHWISYGHYIYGYPFYLYSALLILPVRLFYGTQFLNQTQIILLILRQFVSVLPMIIAILILVFMQTEFHNRLISITLFIFMLSIPGVVRNNISWWHPDALVCLSVVLTLFCLYKDKQQFRGYFYLAAFFCGLSISIKSIGVFFVLTISGYILCGLYLKKITIKQGVIKSIIFLIIMVSVVVFTNPLLLKTPQRNRILEVHLEHHYYFTHGWPDGEPYSTGLKSWIPVISKWYGKPFFIIFTLLSIIYGSIKGKFTTTNRLILSWILPYSVYIIAAVAVKPDHYWLPVLIPFISAIFSFQSNNTNLYLLQNQNMKIYVHRLIDAAVYICILIQFIINLSINYQLFKNTMG